METGPTIPDKTDSPRDSRKPRRSKRARFLESLRAGLSVSGAAESAGMARPYAYELRKKDEAFAEAWDDAIDQGADVLEDEALRRSVKGVDRPVFQGGKQVGVIREYSDSLLTMLLKARRPDKFKERLAQEVTSNPLALKAAEVDGAIRRLLDKVDGEGDGRDPNDLA